MKSIAIIASFRNEAESLDKFISSIEKISKNFKRLDYKIIFVNDFSNDDSEKVIKNKMKTNKKILLINTKKNYGGSNSIHYGFNLIPKNFYATVIDCDLQDPIHLIFKTLDIAKKNVLYHFQRIKRNEGLFQITYTTIAYIILSLVSLNKIVFNSNYFKIIPPYIVEKIKSSNEIYPYWNYFIFKYAIKNKIIKYKRRNRILGQPKFGIFNTNPWATFYSALGCFFANSFIFFILLIILTHLIFFKLPLLNFFLILLQVSNLVIFVIFHINKKYKKKIKLNVEVIY